MTSSSVQPDPEERAEETSAETTPETPQETTSETSGSPVWAFVLTLFLQGAGLTYASAGFREGLQAIALVLLPPLVLTFLYALVGWHWLMPLSLVVALGLTIAMALRAARLAKAARPREKILSKVLIMCVVTIIINSITTRAIRTWAVEPFKVSATSMEPTLSPGDHFFVNKMAYGLWNPLSHTKNITGQGPKRGDIIVFVYPKDPKKDFVKRVIGLPGDTIALKDGALFVNGKAVKRSSRGIHTYKEYEPPQWKTRKGQLYQETLFGVSYKINRDDQMPSSLRSWDSARDARMVPDVHLPGKQPIKRAWGPKIPKGHVFVLGDNRDNSSDSREWGLVPFTHIKGKATLIWLSFRESFRWGRVYQEIH